MEFLSILVSDNDSQFAGNTFKWFYDELNIEHHHASVKHAQMNGQVEADNKIVMNVLNKRIDVLKGKWADELDYVL